MRGVVPRLSKRIEPGVDPWPTCVKLPLIEVPGLGSAFSITKSSRESSGTSTEGRRVEGGE